jgi:hypothetical protein
MSDRELVVVHTFGSRPEADLAKSALEAAGIDAMVQADTAGGEYPGVALARGVAIIVRAEDEPAAREILELPARES